MGRATTTPAVLWSLFPAGDTTVHPATAPAHCHPGLPGTPYRARCGIRLIGPIVADRLQAAAADAVRVHPALRRWLVDAPTGPALQTAAGIVASRADGVPPIVTLQQDPDGSHLLTVCPAPGSVDETGLLAAVVTIADAYRGHPVTAAPITAEIVEQTLSELPADPRTHELLRHWQAYAHELTTPGLARTLMAGPPGGTPRRTPLRLDPCQQAALHSEAARLGVGVQALLLTAWRVLLLRAVPDESGSLALFAPGPVDQVPGVAGLFGRRAPIPVRPAAASAPGYAATVRACEQELGTVRDHAGVFTGPPAPGWTAGFHHLRVPDLDFGPHVQATVVQVWAPTEPVGVDLRVVEAQRSVTIELVDTTRPAGSGGGDLLLPLLGTLLGVLPVPDQTLIGAALDHVQQPRLHGDRRTVTGTVLTALAAQAGRVPHAVAARDEHTELDYAGLCATVDRLSRTLAGRGVAAGQRVAVCMGRRVPLLVALLAVMHRGAAFVPVDPSVPASRIAEILADADPVVVLTDPDTAGLLPDGTPAHVIAGIDTAAGSPDESAAAAAPQDTAYVIYTSGSTGRPKGVPITHAALMNYLSWAASHYGVEHGSGTLVHSSIAVDMTITSLLLPLLAGTTVTLLASDEPADLARTIRASRNLSPFKVTPGGLRLLNAQLTGAELARAVRHLVVGGEQLTTAALPGPDAAGLPVTNEYGPTETTVGCCAHTFRIGDHLPDGPVPIGLPVWNTDLSVQNAGGTPVLPGTAGELVVTGVQVCAGYLHPQPGHHDRFTTGGGSPGYRTGDIVFVRFDGMLQLVGRADDQLKIRGYRVEPAEVEAVLAVHPDITAVVVTATADESGPVLTAFLTTGGGADVIAWAQAQAADRLPFYARPDRYTTLDRIPLHSNGKVDREALQRWQPPAATPQAVTGDDPALNTLAQLWQQILGAAPDGPDANFFASGADSVTAVLLSARARQAGLSVSVRDILEHRTLRAIAALAQTSPAAAATTAAGPIGLTPHQRGVLDSPGVRWRRWTLQSVTALPDTVDAADLEAALLDLLREHPALRTVFADDGTTWTAQIIDPAPHPVEVVDLTGLPHQDRQHTLTAALHRSADQISLAGPLVHTVLILDDRPPLRRVAVTVHHLVGDVVSLHHLTDRLRRAGQPAGPVADGYRDWVRDVQQLPATRFPGPSPAAAPPQEHVSRLDAGIADALLDRYAGRAAAAALAAVTVCALADVRPDLPAAVCVELHGRDRGPAELAATVGWLTEFRALTARPDQLTDLAQLAAALHADLNRPAGPAPAVLPGVAVNYLGRLTTEPPDPPQPGQAPALFPLEVIAWAHPDGIGLRWRYDPATMPAATVEHLARAFTRHAAALTHAGRPAGSDAAADRRRTFAPSHG